jgi:hypothetical protein
LGDHVVLCSAASAACVGFTWLLLLLLQCELLDGGVDVLVATPGRLLSHLEKRSLSLQHTAALVMDEVDVLAGACAAICLWGW